MPTSGGPGQQAIPKPIRAMPATRPTGMATPMSCSPNNNCPTNDGTISKAKPVAASPTSGEISTPFSLRRFHPVFFVGRFVGNGRKLLGLRGRVLLGFELEGQLVDLAGELERNIVAIFQQRDPGTGVLADVEGFVLRKRDRGGVFHGILRHFLAVHGEHARTPLAQTWTIRLEIKDDGVLAGFQLGPLPDRTLEVEQVIEEHHLAPIKASFSLAQEQTIAAEAPALSYNHALCATLGDLDLGSDGVGFVQDTRARRWPARRSVRPNT